MKPFLLSKKAGTLLASHCNEGRKMKELWIVLRKEKSYEVKALLQELGIDYVSRTVLGKGKEGGVGYATRKGLFSSTIPKSLVIAWVEDWRKDEIIQRVIKIAQTGHYGDGKIFVLGGSG